MRPAAIVAALSMAGAAQSQSAASDAQPASGNPLGVKYKATLPDQTFFKQAALSGNVKGHITAETAPDGVGVKFRVRFENLPKEGGPFPYHIHVVPVPADGNCTATLAHLDPMNRGEEPPCNQPAPATCQVGDLSGKHGKASSDPFVAEYVDRFVSLKPGDASFMGNRSFVIHFANKTRLTCANFVNVADANNCPGQAASTAMLHGNATQGGCGRANQSTPPIVTSGTASSGSSLPLMATLMVAAAAFLTALR